MTDLILLLSSVLEGMLMLMWTHGATVGALAAALFAAWYTLITHGIFRLQQTPVVTAHEAKEVGTLGMDRDLTSLRNSGPGPAFNVCIHQEGSLDLVQLSWLGTLGPGETRNLPRQVRISSIEDQPHFIWYQDARRRWYATRLATHGYGLASVWEGRKRWWVPTTVRQNARAETIVQLYRQLGRYRFLKRFKR